MPVLYSRFVSNFAGAFQCRILQKFQIPKSYAAVEQIPINESPAMRVIKADKSDFNHIFLVKLDDFQF